MASYIGNNLADGLLKTKRTEYVYTVSGANSVSGADDNSKALSTPALVEVLVFVDGVLLPSTDYTVGTDIVTFNAAQTGEVVIITELQSALINAFTRNEAIVEIDNRIATAVQNIDLDDLTDVDLATNGPQIGQTIIWDGSNFVPGDSFNQSDFDTAFAAKDTDDLSEGSTNLYYTDARFDTRLGTKSTTDLTEGTNLYYTDTRADARIALQVGTNLDLSNQDTDDLTEGSTNLYYTDGRVQTVINANTAGFLTTETNDLTSAVTWANVPDANITQSSVTQHQAALSITESQISDLQSYLTSETTTSLSLSTNILTYTDETGTDTDIDLSLYLDDTNLAYIVSGSVNASTGVATFTRDDATSFTVDFSAFLDDTNLTRIDSAAFANGTLTLTRGGDNTTVTVSLDGRYLQDLSAQDTDDLAEGSTNLYYTDARADARIAAASVGDLSDVDITTAAPTANQALVWDAVNSKFVPGDSFSQSDFDTAFGNKTTTDLTEGTNLYYTDARVQGVVTKAYVDGLGVDYTTLANLPTIPADISDLTDTTGLLDSNAVTFSTTAPSSPASGDLWYDTTVAEMFVYDGTSWLTTTDGVGDYFVDKTTDDLTEGTTNLYYTDARVQAYLTANNVGAEVNDLTASVTWANVPDANITQSSVTQHQAALSITESQISDLQNYLTSYTETNDLTSAVTWANVPDANITESSVTQHEAALSITESQISDLQSYLTSETVTSLGIASNILSYVDEAGATTNIDLSLYLDDTNLAYITSGSVNASTGVATFTRDDATSFTVDFSAFLDDTNLTRIDTANFANGTLTLTRTADGSSVIVSLDGRYLQDITAESVGDLSDVDITTTAPTAGQALVWDAVNSKFIPGDSFSQSDFDTAFAAKDTDDLSEGSTNLYYTDLRANTAIDTRVDKTFVENLGIDYSSLTNPPAPGNAVSFGTSAPSSPSSGDLWYDTSVAEMFVYDGTSWLSTTDGVGDFFVDKSTDDLTEGSTNLYYTDARVQSYLTAQGVGTEVNDLTSAVTWANVPDANITQSSVTQHQAALSITESQISDLQSYALASSVPSSIGDLSDVDITTAAPTDTQVLKWDNANSKFVPGDAASSIANLTDVDLTGLANNSVLKYDSTASEWIVGTNSTAQATANVIVPFAFANVETTSNGSGTNISWSNWNSSNSTLDFTFGTAQANTQYTVVTDSETYDDFYVGITNKTTTGFRAEFYDNSGSRTPSNFSPFTFIIYGETPTETIYADSYASIGDLPDVDLSTAPTDGQILHWDNTNGVFVPTDKAAPETLTSIALNGNSLDYTDENGTTTNISLAAYLDDTTNTVLSAALSGTTITFTREDSTTFTLDVTNLYDDTNLVTSVNGAQGAVVLDTDDVSEGATNLYHTDARALAATDGEIVKFANMFATVNDLPNATTYHGMFAHVHATGKGYFAHAGNWVELANVSEIPTVPTSIDAFADVDLTGITTGQVLKWDGTKLVASADNEGTTINSIDDIGDVDTTTAAPTNGQALVWDGSNWVPGTVAASGSSVTVSDAAPSSPSEGDMWFDSTNLTMMVYYDSFWVEATTTADTHVVQVSDTAPLAAVDNTLWWNSTDGNLYVYYNDGDSTQWVQSNSTDLQINLSDLSNVDLTGAVNGNALVFDGTNWVAGQGGTDLSTADTDDLAEGSTNLYYTDTRVGTYLTSNSYATETFVSTAVSNLVDSAPTTLDTLNELAAALGDDPNFATTITASIGTKWTEDATKISNWDTAYGWGDHSTAGYLTSYTETDPVFTASAAAGITTTNITNWDTAYGWGDHSAAGYLTSETTTSLALASNTLTYTDETGATTNISLAAYLDDTTNTVSSGTLSGNTITFTRQDSSTFTVDVTALYDDTNLVTSVNGQTGAVTITTYTDADADARIAAASIGDLSDVDITTAAPTDGQTIVWDNANSKFVPGSAGGSSVAYGSTAPSTPSQGDLWFDTTDGELYVYNGSAWVTTHPVAAPDLSQSSIDDLSDVDTSTAAPSNGDLLIWNATNTAWEPGAAPATYGDSDVGTYLSSNGYDTAANITAAIVDTAPTTLDTLNELAAALGDDPNFATTITTLIGTKADSTSVPTALTDLSITDGTADQVLTTDGAGNFTFADASGGASVTTSTTAPTSPNAGDLWFDTDEAILYVYYDDGSTAQWVQVSEVSADGGASHAWSEAVDPHTAVANDRLFVDTSSSAVQVNLPASPTMGTEVRIIDATGNASTNNITINRNGSNIEGAAENLVIDVDRAAFGLVYYNATQGWIFMEK